MRSKDIEIGTDYACTVPGYGSTDNRPDLLNRCRVLAAAEWEADKHGRFSYSTGTRKAKGFKVARVWRDGTLLDPYNLEARYIIMSWAERAKRVEAVAQQRQQADRERSAWRKRHEALTARAARHGVSVLRAPSRKEAVLSLADLEKLLDLILERS